jgi:hypothetical protein
MCKISEKDLFNEGFENVYNERIFDIYPNPVYRKYYHVNGNQCPIFIIKYGDEYCHIVPANNSIRCAFVPIKSVEQLENLISVLSGTELSAE